MNIEDDILIERFLRDLLPESEKQLVLERIASDADFKDKVVHERELIESLNEEDWHFLEDYNKEQVEEYTSILKSKELTDLKAELKRANEAQKESEIPIRTLNWKRVLVSSAAVIAILLSVYVFSDRSTTTQELYADYLNTADLPSLVSRDDASDDLAEAQMLFEKADYESALILLNKAIISRNEPNGSLLLYKGISEMQLDKFSEADLVFDALIVSDLLDAEKGYWYKALLYLKQDDKISAIEVLEDIVSNALYNNDKAKTLLKALED